MDIIMAYVMMDSYGAGEKEPHKNWKIPKSKKMRQDKTVLAVFCKDPATH